MRSSGPLVALSTLAALAAILPAPSAWAGAPTEQLRQSVERVLRVLADPQLKGETRTDERRGAIRAIAGEIFDFVDISQRALGRHWQARTPAERDEFVGLFGELLERAYVTKIEGYTGERILYTGEVADGAFATVRTRIVTKQGTEVPVDYKMFNQSERWRAYDVSIEGVSLVANYRTQFSSIIGRHSYQELVARLRVRQEERAAQEATARSTAHPSQGP
jgi:phospholipid transport system substrate-binding protein